MRISFLTAAALLAVGVSGAAEAAVGGNFAESLSGQSVSGMVGSLSAGNGSSAIATGIGKVGTQTTFSPTQFTSVSNSTGQFSLGTTGPGSTAEQQFNNFATSIGSGAFTNGQFVFPNATGF